MKAYLITNSLEEVAEAEVKEKLNVSSSVNTNVLEFSGSNLELVKFARSCQSGRRLLVALDKNKDSNDLAIDCSLSDYFSNETKFKVVVEGVKGQDNRIPIAKGIAGKVFAKLEEEKIESKLELKNPELLVVVYFNGSNYYLGIDLIGKELDAREYRVFTSSASFKGDFGYGLLHYAKFKVDEKALFGFVKDGTLAIEAALWVNNLPLLRKKNYSYSKMKAFNDIEVEFESGSKEIFATDSNMGNINSCRRNSSLAKVKEVIKIQKYSLEDWDVKFDENEFDLVVLQVTSKDEDKLNEMYYQASYILKSGGRLMFVARPNWEPSISEKFKLIEKKELARGDGKHTCWLLERL